MHGLAGVFRVLSEQHGEAGALLRRLKADPKRRADLWPTIRAELTSHEKAELAIVYPALRAEPELRRFAEQHDREAKELSSTIEQLQTTDMTLPRWGDLLDTLIGLVEAHAKEEENEIFPQAQTVLGADRIEALEKPFLTAKKHAMQAMGVPV
jgi:hemerythrin superfamily protein